MNQQKKRQPPTNKKCKFCKNGAIYIDYKDYPSIRPYLDYFGNIRKRYYSGTCLKCQKMLRVAVERARFVGMVAYRK